MIAFPILLLVLAAIFILAVIIFAISALRDVESVTFPAMWAVAFTPSIAVVVAIFWLLVWLIGVMR